MLGMIQKHYAESSLLKQLEAHPEVWDNFPYRTQGDSPHRELSDIWVRYNPIENFDGDMKRFNSEHVSQWYPVAEALSEAKRISHSIALDFGVQRLGAVLITKIPAGKQCYPHVDLGWHARYYEKLAFQVKGNLEQSFHVEDQILRTEDGDLFYFDNSKIHWVLNPSAEDRITLIICVRRH